MRKKEPKIVICEIADTYKSNPGLTFKKEYTVIREEDNKYVLIDNNGKETTYYKSRFRTK